MIKQLLTFVSLYTMLCQRHRNDIHPLDLDSVNIISLGHITIIMKDFRLLLINICGTWNVTENQAMKHQSWELNHSHSLYRSHNDSYAFLVNQIVFLISRLKKWPLQPYRKMLAGIFRHFFYTCNI